MRPTRLELAGFGSFRDAVEVDFTDVDLFVLSGATGAGKTTVIDGMTFALYGSIPRYDDRRLVAPVVSKGKTEARVRLDFEVGGTPYTAVRVVRLTGENKATTKEARLESHGATLASGADEVTAAAEKLLGLPFQHFTRCVVLPQGEFAEFLHAKPKERNDLIVALLDLEVYRDVGRMARERKLLADQEVTLAQQALDGMPDASDAALDAGRRRETALRGLLARCDEQAPRIQELRDEWSEARREETGALERVGLLEEVRVPAGIEELAGRIREAADAVDAAERAATEAAAAADAAEQQRSGLPARDEVTQRIRAAEERATLGEESTRLEREAEVRRTAVTGADAEAEAAEAALTAARSALDALRQRHTARELARHLEVGDDCPVCDRAIESPLDVEVPDDLAEAERAVQQAEQHLQATTRSARAAAEARTEIESRLTTLEERRSRIDALLVGAPPLADLQAQLDAIVAAEAAAEEARRAERSARQQVSAARSASSALDDERKAAWSRLDQARMQVAALDPPQPDREDLVAAWDALAEWAAVQVPAHRDAAKAASERAETALETGRRIQEELRAAATEAGVPAVAQDPRDDVVQAIAHAEQQVKALEQARERAAELRDRVDAATRTSRVAKELGEHLKANKFEKWLMTRALGGLVQGASGLLSDLSNGAYTLDLDSNNNFLVIDHRNAGEKRNAKTLSGGETFLASLSLALALSERVADMAANGGARLDALFLDEGFGTLDPDTLDVVASAIEELGSRRMVGIVTHVRDLAERIPVRFEVTKESTTSRVTRHVA